MGVEAAQHKTAAVKEHEQRMGTRRGRCVDSQGERAARAGDGAIGDNADRRGRCHQTDAPPHHFARLCDGEGLDLR
jgi:hypothetical protein